MRMLIVDGVKYNLFVPKDERQDFQPVVKQLSKEIFGPDSIYFEIEHTLRSRAGIGAKPEGFVIDLKNEQWYIVEVELSKHNPYDHIVNQLTRFVNGIDNLKVRNSIVSSLYKLINKDELQRFLIEKRVGRDIHHWLTRLISKTPKIVVIIEEKTPAVVEACKILTRSFDTHILELKIFTRENAEDIRAYLFEPLHAIEKTSIIKAKKRERPLHYTSWEAKLAWVNEDVRNLVQAITKRILQLKSVTHRPSGTSYEFFKGETTERYAFAALVLTKKVLKVRIRTDPATFQDSQKWTGEKVFHWFFRTGEEKSFNLTEESKLDYAMELVKQSYELIK